MATRKASWLSCSALVALSACTATCLPPAPATTSSIAGPQAPGTLAATYERSIRAAAVREPSFTVRLRTIGPQQARVAVATFTEWGLPASPTE